MWYYFRHQRLHEYFQRQKEEIKKRAERGLAERGVAERGVAYPEWFPAGLSPYNFPWEGEGEGGVSTAEEVQLDQISWMDEHTLSSRELHRAASQIQRWVWHVGVAFRLQLVSHLSSSVNLGRNYKVLGLP